MSDQTKGKKKYRDWKSGDNRYIVIVLFPDGKAGRWHSNNLNSFIKFLDKDHSEWHHMNIYDSRSRKFLKQFYKGNNVAQLGIYGRVKFSNSKES